MKRIASLCAASLLGVLILGCHPKITPAPPPLRPKPTAPIKTDPPPDPNARTDCEPSKDTIAPYTYQQRSVSEGEDLATRGVKSLNAAGQAADEVSVDNLMTSAVKDLLAALAADPYNVNATYNLAAAYARIDRPQCSINMLKRLIEMKDHPSQKDAVNAKLDHLLGRGKQTIDPDFDKMRTDDRFRELIKGI